MLCAGGGAERNWTLQRPALLQALETGLPRHGRPHAQGPVEQCLSRLRSGLSFQGRPMKRARKEATMYRRAVSFITLAAFLVFTFSCVIHRTKATLPDALAQKGGKVFEITAILTKSGERIEFPKGSHALVSGDKIESSEARSKIYEIPESEVQKMSIDERAGSPNSRRRMERHSIRSLPKGKATRFPSSPECPFLSPSPTWIWSGSKRPMRE